MNPGEPQPTGIKPGGLDSGGGSLKTILTGQQPVRTDNISTSYHLDNGARRIDVLAPSLIANPDVTKLYGLMRSAQGFKIGESEGYIHAETSLPLNPNNSRLGEFVGSDGRVDLEDLGALENPLDFAGHKLTHLLVGRKDGSITTLYRGTTQAGQPGWVEVLDTRLMDDESVKTRFINTRRDVDKVHIDEVDGRLIAVYTAEPTTINNATVLQGIYDDTNAEGGEAAARQAIQEIIPSSS